MNNIFDLTSLRGKITSAYIVLVISTVVLGVIAISDLLFLGRQVAEGEVVYNLKDEVLEMRREEKNLFLYSDINALSKADEHAELAQIILQDNSKTLSSIVNEPDPVTMLATVNAYREKLAQWKTATVSNREQVQEEIRALGHQIYVSAELLSGKERQLLGTAISESRWFLLLTILLIVVSILIVGRQLKRVVVNPLKQLESRLMPIARGQFKHLEPPSNDREFVTFTDAFNRMLKELEIRQKRMLQSEKLASLGILASGVAHELNNPLSNISSSCQLLLEELTEAEPAQLNAWLKQIDSETERGRNIVRTLLDFGSQRAFQKEQLNLLSVINETQIIIGKSLREYAADLSINIPSELVLNADKQRIQQLFINLIQNSLHASGQGGHLRISAIITDRSVSMIPEGAEVAGSLDCSTDYHGQFVEILVSDDGQGIPSDNLSKIFEPFFTTSEPGRGIGLGLFIAQEIVREHDGCIAISSTPGKGTQVILLFPHKGKHHA